MKTSKYIQTALLVFIFTITLLLFLDAKSYTEKSLIKAKGYYDSKLLNDFSVIVAEENSKLWIRKDSINRGYYQYRDEGLKEDHGFGCFSLKNDTLFVSRIETKYIIYINSQATKNIVAKENSEIGFLGYHNDTLNLTVTKAKVTGSLKNGSINLLKIDADNHSNISFTRMKIKIIDSITKEELFVPINEKLKEAEITLKGHSSLRMPKPGKLIIDSDETSEYTIFKTHSNKKELISSSTIKKAN